MITLLVIMAVLLAMSATTSTDDRLRNQEIHRVERLVDERIKDNQ